MPGPALPARWRNTRYRSEPAVGGDRRETVTVEMITFAAADASTIDRFDSVAASVNRLARVDGQGAVAAIRLGPGGRVGRHPAVKTQLFVVIDGSGMVSGDDGVEIAITSGHAALWRAGEHHESSTTSGMTAIVIEVDAISCA